MVVCFNLHPCIDDNIIDGENNSCLAGKGLNVCRYLKALGQKTYLLGFMASGDEAAFSEELHRLEIPFSFSTLKGNVRRNIKILSGGKLIEQNKQGDKVMEENMEELLQEAGEVCRYARGVVLSGSLPLGVEADFYSKIIEQIPQGIPVFLDTGGEALRATLSPRIALVKPNQFEAEEFIRKRINVATDTKEAAKSICAAGSGRVLLSLGENGGIYYDGEDMYLAHAVGELINPVGAGDCMLASAVNAYLLGHPSSEVLRHAIAAAGAKVSEKNVMGFDVEKYKRLLPDVEIKKI